jgi:hypothetical protein
MMARPMPFKSRRIPKIERDRLAALFLLTCSILAAIGGLREWNRSGTNEWKTRFLAGAPVTVSFICGTDNPFDCRSSYEVSYSTTPNLCEHARVDGAGDKTGWCNADPSSGSFSITGTIFNYDRLGAVRLASRLVGQLFVPK